MMQQKVWAIDIYGDPAWVESHYKEAPRLSFNTVFSDAEGSSPKIRIDFLGDATGVKHLSMTGRFASKEDVEDFISRFLYKYIRNLEVLISAMNGQSFYFWRLPGYPFGALSFGEIVPGQERVPLKIKVSENANYEFDYDTLGNLIGNTFSTFHRYSFFLQQAMDPVLPLDYRWLNLYKVCEARFNKTGAALIHSNDWVKIADKFQGELKSCLRPGQKSTNLLEELRALAAHSIARGGGGGFGHHMGQEAERKLNMTFPILTKIVHEIINSLPENNGKLNLFIRPESK